mgnify:CR=1 FL=1
MFSSFILRLTSFMHLFYIQMHPLFSTKTWAVHFCGVQLLIRNQGQKDYASVYLTKQLVELPSDLDFDVPSGFQSAHASHRGFNLKSLIVRYVACKKN